MQKLLRRVDLVLRRHRPVAVVQRQKNTHNPILKRRLCAFFIALPVCMLSPNTHAWAPEGHTAIGILALERLQPDTRDRLEDIVGTLDEQAIADACIWPDTIRDEKKWEWSKPLHYVNIPRGEDSFDEARDCKKGRCATGAIKKYAAELGDASLSKEKRQQAFNWLCHVVGDLHQPMHAGFGDDRGGNTVQLMVRGEEKSLHYYWDSELTRHYAGEWQDLYRILGSTPLDPLAGTWSPDDVNTWTEESHRIARDEAYPPKDPKDNAWERKAWEIAQQRLRLAATRLAQVIETVLGR